MEYEKCYIFDGKASRPLKRRRVEPVKFTSSLESRKSSFVTLWGREEQKINEVVRAINESTLRQIADFLNQPSSVVSKSKIPAGFVTTGSGSITHATLFEQLSDVASSRGNVVFVSLTASEAPNLKTVLKNLISKVTKVNDESDGENDAGVTRRHGPKLLNYDLERLFRWFKTRAVEKIVVTLQDSEAFDVGVLTDLWTVLSSWLDRLPFVLLLGIATSVEVFVDRLPRTALNCLSGQSFDVTAADDMLETVFESTITSSTAALRIGSALSDKLLQRQRDYTQSIESFTDALKYAYMCHFYGNPLSVFLTEEIKYHHLTTDDFEAIRNLPSFRQHAEALLDRKEAGLVRALLQSDEELFKDIIGGLAAGQTTISWILGAIRVVQDLRRLLDMKGSTSFASLYIKALSGELVSSPTVRELLLLVKKAPSDTLEKMLPLLIDTLMTMPASDVSISPDDFRDIQDELSDLISNTQATSGPIRSEHDAHRTTHHTTIVAQRVTLRSTLAAPSAPETAYTALATRLHSLLSTYFVTTLSSATTLYLSEILIYDQLPPHRSTFTPRPRPALERALSAPHDYLGCLCCIDSKDTLAPTQPPTAVLYQLYLETGALINTMDLWSAFNAIVGARYKDEEMTTALFMRGLAELKYLGLVKGSRKKVDHLAKLAWKGL